MSKQEQNDSYKSQQKVSFFNFLAELPNFIAVTVSAIISGVFDCLDGFCGFAR